MSKILAPLVILSLILTFLLPINVGSWGMEQPTSTATNFSATNYRAYQHISTTSTECLAHYRDTWPAEDLNHDWFGPTSGVLPLGFSWQVAGDCRFYWGERILLQFDTSSIDPNTEIAGGRIYIKFANILKSGATNYAIGFWPYDGDQDSALIYDDWLNIVTVSNPLYKVAGSQTYEACLAAFYAGTYITFELTEWGRSYINKGGLTKAWFVFGFDGAGLTDLPKVYNGLVLYEPYVQSPAPPKLELDLVAGYSTRETCTQNNTATGGSGDNLTGISWMTPRCLWDDETAGFRVEGEYGCPIDLHLVGDSEELIASTNDTIRDNNYFYWYPELNGYTGPLKLYELTTNTTSTYGWSEHWVDAGSMRTWASNFEHEETSWARPIQDYVTEDPGETLTYYWTSGLEQADLNTTTLKVFQGGGQVGAIYNSTLSSLSTGYFLCEDSCNELMVANRYIKATMGEVEDDLDGLIIDLDNPLTATAHGYYYLRIEHETDMLFPVTAYWYAHQCTACPAACDIDIRSSGSFDSGGTAQIAIENNADLDLLDQMNDIHWEWLDAGTDAWLTLTDAIQLFSMTVPYGGDDTLLVELGGTSDDYIERRTFISSGTEDPEDPGWPPGLPDLPGGGTYHDWWGWIVDLFNSTAGHWIILAVAWLIVLLVAWRRNKVVAILICLGIFAAGLIIGWVDWWIVVVIGIIGGIILWRQIVGARQGG